MIIKYFYLLSFVIFVNQITFKNVQSWFCSRSTAGIISSDNSDVEINLRGWKREVVIHQRSGIFALWVLKPSWSNIASLRSFNNLYFTEWEFCFSRVSRQYRVISPLRNKTLPYREFASFLIVLMYRTRLRNPCDGKSVWNDQR